MPKQPDRFGRRELLTAAGAGVLATIFPLAASAGDAATPFLGTFTFSGGDKERQAWEKAIDDVVSGMNAVVRGIARDKLKKSNPIATTLAFAADAKNLTVAFDSRTYTAPLDGAPVRITSILGDDMIMAFKIAGSDLDQRFTGSDDGRTNQFHVDGKTCVMRVRVFSSKLPKDLVYALSYSK